MNNWAVESTVILKTNESEISILNHIIKTTKIKRQYKRFKSTHKVINLWIGRLTINVSLPQRTTFFAEVGKNLGKRFLGEILLLFL
jgi:hypothetical protein